MERDDIVNCFEHVHNFDARSDGQDIANFLVKKHQFDGDVLLTIKNFEDAGESKEDIGMSIKSYYESHFFGYQPKSLTLISGIDGSITRYDGTLNGGIKTVR